MLTYEYSRRGHGFGDAWPWPRSPDVVDVVDDKYWATFNPRGATPAYIFVPPSGTRQSHWRRRTSADRPENLIYVPQPNNARATSEPPYWRERTSSEPKGTSVKPKDGEDYLSMWRRDTWSQWFNAGDPTKRPDLSGVGLSLSAWDTALHAKLIVYMKTRLGVTMADGRTGQQFLDDIRAGKEPFSRAQALLARQPGGRLYRGWAKFAGTTTGGKLAIIEYEFFDNDFNPVPWFTDPIRTIVGAGAALVKAVVNEVVCPILTNSSVKTVTAVAASTPNPYRNEAQAVQTVSSLCPPPAAAPAAPPTAGKYPAGTLARFNRTRGVWSIYVPMATQTGLGIASSSGMCVYGRCALGDAAAVTPPPPVGYMKVGEEAAQPVGTAAAGTEDDVRPWYKNPLIIGGLVVGVAAIGTGTYLVLRRR